MSSRAHMRQSIVNVTRAEALRVDAFVIRIGGVRRAGLKLGVGDTTIDTAVGEGRLLVRTRDKLIAALDREGA